MKAQVSMEYMAVVGFTLLMLLPIVAIYGMERQGMRDQINIKQAQNIGRKIVDAAETTYFLGKPAKTTLKVYMPPDVYDIHIGNNEIVFVMKIGNVLTEVPPPYSSVNLSGSLSNKQGIQYIQISADHYQVNITNKEG